MAKSGGLTKQTADRISWRQALFGGKIAAELITGWQQHGQNNGQHRHLTVSISGKLSTYYL